MEREEDGEKERGTTGGDKTVWRRRKSNEERRGQEEVTVGCEG